MESTPSGEGYWLVAADGGIFAFGNAPFLGSIGGTPLNQPVVGMDRTPNGGGYYLVATDGGIFAFGNAPFLGTCVGQSPQIAIYADTNGDGTFDATNKITCTGAGPLTASADPVTGGTNPLPATAVVTGIDILYAANGTAKIDDIQVSGITMSDHRTFTAAGTALG